MANNLHTDSTLHVDNKYICDKKEVYLLNDFLRHSKKEV